VRAGLKGKLKTNPDFQAQVAVPAKNSHLWKFLLFSRPPRVYNHISSEEFQTTNGGDIMKRQSILVLIMLGVCVAGTNADMVTFDDLALGDYGDSLRYGDIVIEAYPGSHLQVTDQSADGMGSAHSSPHKLSVWGDQPWVPKEKTSFMLVFDDPVVEVGFWITGTFHDTTASAYNAADDLLTTFVQTYPMDEPRAPDGRPWDYYYADQLRFINLKGPPISKVSIQPSGYTHFSMDDVSYEVVPAPGAVILGSIGITFSGWLLHKRRML